MTRPLSQNSCERRSGWAIIAGLWVSGFGPRARWIIVFVAACIGLVSLVIFLIWAASGFVNLRSIGLSGNVLAGLIIGITVSAGLGAGLMALVFQSERDGQDDAVYRAAENPNPPLASSSTTRDVGP